MTLTDEEKIQKAQEIYYRRNGINYRQSKPEKKHPIRNFIVVLLVIGIVLGYQNKELLMSPEFQNQVKSFLNTKIDMNSIFSPKQENVENVPNVSVPEKEAILENTVTYDVIWPYNGTITSGFGTRTSDDSRVTANHTGIDIAGNIGDEFVCAAGGTVILVSEEGDLGKHVKIENEKYITVYAHCSEIYVHEGDTVEQNTKIGKVGSTGNSTGPHLHFEVIQQGDYIDPLTVIEKQVENEG